MGAPFVHLHVHSDYSLLDGAVTVRQIVELARRHGMGAVALTDHGVLFGAMEFQHLAHARGVKPILGCEVHVERGDRGGAARAAGEPEAHHLTLLAENRTGYENLCRIVSAGFLAGYRGPEPAAARDAGAEGDRGAGPSKGGPAEFPEVLPRVKRAAIERHHEGLIGLSGCLASEISVRVLRGGMDEALAAAAFYRDLFGEGRYYVEIMDHGLGREAEVNRDLLEIARRLGIPVVATNDVHYAERGDERLREAIFGTLRGASSDGPCQAASAAGLHFASAEEMATRFKDLPEALANTCRIAERCDLDLERESPAFRFATPDGSTPEAFLRRLCEEAVGARMPEVTEGVRARLAEELRVVGAMGCASTMLAHWDLVRRARERGIAVGPGSGLVPGSLVAYLLGITDVDPMRHGLLFERFLNPARRRAPDIPIGVAETRRHEMEGLLRERYGADRVGRVARPVGIEPCESVEAVCRFLGLPATARRELKELFDREWTESHGMLSFQPMERYPAYRREPRVKAIVDTARRFGDLCRGVASAPELAVGDGPLTDKVPVFPSNEGVTIQYRLCEAQEAGLQTFTVLGKETLSVIACCLDLLGRGGGTAPDVRALPLDDPKTYALLGRAHLPGLDLAETTSSRDFLARIRPDRLDHVAAFTVLDRWGPASAGTPEAYCRRRNGEEEVRYVHPRLAEWLEGTYGLILYDEQVMQIAQGLGGFAPEEAYLFRRAIDRQKLDEPPAYETRFLAGCEHGGISRAAAGEIWDQLMKEGDWAAAKSHAVGCAHLVYRAAYLMAHHPAEYMAALLTCHASNEWKVILYAADARQAGIEVVGAGRGGRGVKFGVVDGRIVRL